MICGGCRGCPTHGMDMMTFKCRFCCSEAMWFCFGHTHFCDPCHSNAHGLAGGDNYLYMKDHPTVCMGKDKCPLGISHPPHGEEFAIRCIACDEVHYLFIYICKRQFIDSYVRFLMVILVLEFAASMESVRYYHVWTSCLIWPRVSISFSTN